MGGSDGIRYGTAKLNVAEGAKVVASGRKRGAGEAAAREICAGFIQVDLSKIEELRRPQS
ncbi:hypothetical protein [uncultured Agrobacterium sp.]|uniref:hypothetical protein n=1 Tax=uncultured Agrobacterium sp. TaxID=157277 RepID=UPI0026004C98|nr:hypothetical protein [uncultured Agrobacterium sp.]